MKIEGFPGTFADDFAPLDLVEKRMPAAVSKMLGAPKAYGFGECHVLHGIEETDTRGGIVVKLHHVSISCPNRYPTWDEMKFIVYSLVPADVGMHMMLPRRDAKPGTRDEYLDQHPWCLHWWETTE